MEKYETLEDFKNIMKRFDNVFVEINSKVFIDLFKVKLTLDVNTFFAKGETKRINYREYNHTTFNLLLDQLIKEKEQSHICNKKYESPDDFNKIDRIWDVFVQINKNLWCNIKNDSKYSRLLDVYTYSHRPLEIIPLENYNKEAYEAYILVKKMI